MSMFKDFLEDKKRWKNDDKENQSVTERLKNGKYEPELFKNLLLGDIVRVKNN